MQSSGTALHHASIAVLTFGSGLAWHTDDGTLRAKFEEFGNVEEAVRQNAFPRIPGSRLNRLGRRQRP